MTDAQKALFISIAQSGIACGLWHPFEWLINYQRTLDCWCVPDLAIEKELEANEAFREFFNECDGCEGDPIKSWTVEEMNAAMNQYFETRRNEVEALRQIHQIAENAAKIWQHNPAISEIAIKAQAALGKKTL